VEYVGITTNISDAFYDVTFVDNEGGKPIYIDAFNNFEYNPHTNVLALGTVSSSYVTSSNIYASENIFGTLIGTASWANNSISSSYSLTSSFSNDSFSSSYAITASYALNSGAGGTTLITGSTYPITSSWSENTLTASYFHKVSASGAWKIYVDMSAGDLVFDYS
jgi:hypothetical protein